jgi:hypothetical protein
MNRGRIDREVGEEAETSGAGAPHAGGNARTSKVPIEELAAPPRTGAETRIDRYCRAALGSGALWAEGKPAHD